MTARGGGKTVTVTINDDTKTQDNRGLFGLEKEQMSDAVLIPGLKVEFDGLSDGQGRVVAKMITVDGDDLYQLERLRREGPDNFEIRRWQLPDLVAGSGTTT